jgi:DHA1 family bicyclomycin/chloramphenicol resistance-like MFS transporter
MTPLPSSWLLISILCLLSCLGIFSISLYLPSLPAIGKAWGTSEKAVQLTLFMFFLGSSLGHLLLGPFSDRVGRLIVAKGGILLFILASFWCAHCQTILQLQLGLFFLGISVSAGSLIARAMGRDLYEGSSLTRFSSTIMMIVSLSPGISPMLGGFIEYHFGWEKKFYFLMVLGIAIALMVWWRLPETFKTSKKITQGFTLFKNYGLFFQDSYYRTLCFIIAMQMSTIFCYVTLSPYIFISFFGWSPQEYGYVGIAGALGNLTGFGLARFMAKRWGCHRGILRGSLSCGLVSGIYVCLCFLLQEQPYLIILYHFCFYSASALAVANASAAALDIFPHRAGMSSAIIGTIQIGSGMVGSLLASLLPVSPLGIGIVLGSLSFLSVGTAIFIKIKNWRGYPINE